MAYLDSILNYKRQEDDDYYKILGCDENSSIEQICAEYKVRALALHPDKNLADKDADKQFQRLQLAKEVLTDPERRRKYDTWLRSGLSVPFDHWLAKKDNMQMSMHWAVRKKKDLMLPCGDESCSNGEVAGAIPASLAPRRETGVIGDVQWCQGSRSDWEQETNPKDVLKKFRNYEI